MQQSNFDIGQQMMAENTPGANAAFSRYMMSERMFNNALQQQRGENSRGEVSSRVADLSRFVWLERAGDESLS
jgi:hypothetical protein